MDRFDRKEMVTIRVHITLGLLVFHRLKSDLKFNYDLEQKSILRDHLGSLLSINEQNVNDNLLQLTEFEL